MKITQCQRIVDYMRRFGSISTLEAFNDLGVARLASRIHDLKDQGYSISSETKSTKNRYGEKVHFKVYKLMEAEETEPQKRERIPEIPIDTHYMGEIIIHCPFCGTMTVDYAHIPGVKHCMTCDGEYILKDEKEKTNG